MESRRSPHPWPRNKHEAIMIPKNPVILSEWGVQAPPKRIVLEGDWIPIGDDDEEEDEQIREP